LTPVANGANCPSGGPIRAAGEAAARPPVFEGDRMVPFDLDFLSRSLGMVGLFFICCSILQTKPKHLLEENFGVYRGGLRRLRGAVFQKNQLVLGFLCALFALILSQFSHIIGRKDGRGLLNNASPGVQIAAWLLFLVVLCGVLNYLCRLFSKRYFLRAIREVAAEHKWPFETNMTLTTEIGDLLGVERRPEDTVAEYVARLKAHLALPYGAEPRRSPTRTSKLEVSFK
jgi:hypothetical protein